MLNILSEPILRVDTGDGVTLSASLPEVYAALMADKVDAFPALRPHQRHAWHAFLVQLGAMAMHRTGVSELPDDADAWASLIRGLTPDWPDDEPWQLVVDDITKPAFMQPPARSKEREVDYKSEVITPDDLDMLVTSKNHDLKSEIAEQATVNDWFFALGTLETMEGFAGAGNYGISRMNGGLGNRPAFSLAPLGQKPGAHVRRDIIALFECRPEILNDYRDYPEDGGVALLWTLPWDGAANETLSPTRLDPLYIEVCRRIRLRVSNNGSLYAIRTSSKAARVGGKDLKGRTGDPWTPTSSKRDGLPLTLSAGGFNYKRVTEYLTSEDWQRPPLLRPTQAEARSEDKMQLVARGMVRGQGKTEGYYERIIPIGHKVKSAMRRGGASQELGNIARDRIEQIGKVQRILSHAIQTFMAKGESDNSSQELRNRARGWLNQLDEIVDRTFFDGLQEEFDAEESQRQTIRKGWLLNGSDGVVDHARNLLHDAADSLPCPAMFRYKARHNAEGLFEGRIRGASGLPFLFDTDGAESDNDN